MTACGEAKVRPPAAQLWAALRNGLQEPSCVLCAERASRSPAVFCVLRGPSRSPAVGCALRKASRSPAVGCASKACQPTGSSQPGSTHHHPGVVVVGSMRSQRATSSQKASSSLP